MIGIAVPGVFEHEAIVERERFTDMLGELCGLAAGESAAHCGRTWCGYFDESRGRCGLLVQDVPAKLGPEALRWFVTHRTTKRLAEIAEVDEILAARACAL